MGPLRATPSSRHRSRTPHPQRFVFGPKGLSIADWPISCKRPLVSISGPRLLIHLSRTTPSILWRSICIVRCGGPKYLLKMGSFIVIHPLTMPRTAHCKSPMSLILMLRCPPCLTTVFDCWENNRLPGLCHCSGGGGWPSHPLCGAGGGFDPLPPPALESNPAPGDDFCRLNVMVQRFDRITSPKFHSLTDVGGAAFFGYGIVQVPPPPCWTLRPPWPYAKRWFQGFSQARGLLGAGH